MWAPVWGLEKSWRSEWAQWLEPWGDEAGQEMAAEEDSREGDGAPETPAQERRPQGAVREAEWVLGEWRGWYLNMVAKRKGGNC